MAKSSYHTKRVAFKAFVEYTQIECIEYIAPLQAISGIKAKNCFKG